MNAFKCALPALAGICLSACTISEPTATNSQNLALTALPVSGESVHPVVSNEQLAGYLVSNEAEGLLWLNTQGKLTSQFKGHIGQTDWRTMPRDNNRIVIAAIDNNTAALHLLTLALDTGEFTPRLSVASEQADRETLCLSRQDNELHLFSTDAQGLLSHFLVNTDDDWQLQAVRQLMVGPNLSSCAVADDSNTVLIAEEETGIWQYSGHSEGENTRTLDYFASGPELESVSALHDGRYFAVATDQAIIRERGIRQQDWPVQADRALKSISAVSANQQIYLGTFDEASGELLVATLPDNFTGTSPDAPVHTLTADVQTTPVNRFGDAADDPAIWVNHQHPAESLVLGTDKKYGLNVYGLDGELRQSLPTGRVNNVDVRYQINTANGLQDIAVASNRSTQTLSVYTIADTGIVSHMTELPTTLTDIYGLCSGMIGNQLHVFVNDTDGRYQQYQLNLDSPMPTASLVSEFSLPSQPEGCVVDDKNQTIYMGEEAAGIWMKDLSMPFNPLMLIAEIGNDVAADIEGMGIYELDNQRYLVASSQGNSRFAVYALDADNHLLGTFRIGINQALSIDGVSETDGLEVTAVPLGADFPHGLMVVQDGRNVMPTAPQNFKLINGSKLADFIRLYR